MNQGLQGRACHCRMTGMSRLDVLCVGLVLGASACTWCSASSRHAGVGDAGGDASQVVADGGVPVTVSARSPGFPCSRRRSPTRADPADAMPEGVLASKPFVEGGGQTTFVPETSPTSRRARSSSTAGAASVGGAVTPGADLFGSVPLLGGVYLRLTRGSSPELFELRARRSTSIAPGGGRPDRRRPERRRCCRSARRGYRRRALVAARRPQRRRRLASRSTTSARRSKPTALGRGATSLETTSPF